MGKTDKIITICAFLMLITVGILAVLSQRGKQENLLTNSESAAVIENRVKALDSSRTAESSRVAGEDFYRKLKEGRSETVLIIGDEIGNSAGASSQNGWIDLLTGKLYKEYKSTFNVIKTDQVCSNSVKGWIEYSRLKDKAVQAGDSLSPDCVFICMGQDDQYQVGLKEFHMFYEDLIVRLIRDYPHAAIFPVIESSFKTENGYTVDLRELSQHYGLNLIDMISAFNSSGKNLSEITKDGIIPNDEGYAVYADAMLQTIEKNVSQGVTAGYSSKPLYFSDTSQISRSSLSTQCSETDGFQNNDDSYVSSRKGDTITFSASGSLLYVYYNTDPNGGIFQIFVDSQYYGEVNTKSAACRSMPFLIYDRLSSGTHQVKFVNKQGAVSIIGIVKS